ncbi:hypothetical protein F01_140219 [Burkholderia cenocepacia]|nr:hypothetical protein F01_140219 [Burkholderia cenocepacia]
MARQAARMRGVRRARQGAPPRRRSRPLHRILQEHVPGRVQPARTEARDRLRTRRRVPDRAARVPRTRRGRHSDRRRAERLQHQRRRRRDRAGRAGARGAGEPRRSRHRARRRRRSPAGRRRGRPPVQRRRAALRAGEGPDRHRRQGRRGGRHADDQPRRRSCAAARGREVRPCGGWRPLRARAVARAWLAARRGRVGPHPVARPAFDRRRHRVGAAGAGRAQAQRPYARADARRRHAVPAEADQRADETGRRLEGQRVDSRGDRRSRSRACRQRPRADPRIGHGTRAARDGRGAAGGRRGAPCGDDRRRGAGGDDLTGTGRAAARPLARPFSVNVHAAPSGAAVLSDAKVCDT